MSAHYPAGCSQSDIDRSSNGDADPIDELDGLTTLDCGHTGTIRNAEQSGGQLVCEECFIHPPQLPRFAERSRPMKAVEQPVCQHAPCDNQADLCCDNCNQYFCSDHGTRGGDRQVEEVGAVAVPSLCWNCGGFNADEVAVGFANESEKKQLIASLVDALGELSK